MQEDGKRRDNPTVIPTPYLYWRRVVVVFFGEFGGWYYMLGITTYIGKVGKVVGIKWWEGWEPLRTIPPKKTIRQKDKKTKRRCPWYFTLLGTHQV